jgi:hypothetical protein
VKTVVTLYTQPTENENGRSYLARIHAMAGVWYLLRDALAVAAAAAAEAGSG